MITDRHLAHKIIAQVENHGFENLHATQFCNGIRCEQCPKICRIPARYNESGSYCSFVQELYPKYGKEVRDSDNIHRKRHIYAWARGQLIGNKLDLI